MSGTDTPERTTGHPAKDSGGGMIWTARLETIDDIVARMDWRVRVLDFELNGGALPIPPDDYARHWELEGPHA